MRWPFFTHNIRYKTTNSRNTSLVSQSPLPISQRKALHAFNQQVLRHHITRLYDARRLCLDAYAEAPDVSELRLRADASPIANVIVGTNSHLQRGNARRANRETGKRRGEKVEKKKSKRKKK